MRGMEVPASTWLPGLFNPTAFITAVLQTSARAQGWALDRTMLVTEVRLAHGSMLAGWLGKGV